MVDDTPTKSAALALADERDMMRQGYEFLDEKRMLLASEILRQLRIYEEREKRFLESLRAARYALGDAVERHGIDNLQVYPPRALAPEKPERSESTFLGVPIVAHDFEPKAGEHAFPPIDPSREAGECMKAFAALLAPLAELAATSSNLHRLAEEYRRTEKRARALENVLLPEVSDRLKRINEHLETFEQEEAIRARLAAGKL
jgi:V/A-type H+-transporting ATPase subunit D